MNIYLYIHYYAIRNNRYPRDYTRDHDDSHAAGILLECSTSSPMTTISRRPMITRTKFWHARRASNRSLVVAVPPPVICRLRFGIFWVTLDTTAGNWPSVVDSVPFLPQREPASVSIDIKIQPGNEFVGFTSTLPDGGRLVATLQPSGTMIFHLFLPTLTAHFVHIPIPAIISKGMQVIVNFIQKTVHEIIFFKSFN